MSEQTADLVTSDVFLVLSVHTAEIRGDDLTSQLERNFAAEVDRSAAAKVVVDLSAVKYLTSTGVRTLLSLYQKVKPAGGRVVLCGVAEMVSEVLQLMRFIDPSGSRPTPFEVQPDVKTAVVSLLTQRTVAGGS